MNSVHLILAQATDPKGPTPFEITSLILTIGMFAVAVVALVIAGRKQKNEVTFGFTPASKDEFDRHVAHNTHEHMNIFSKIGGAERGMDAKLKEVIKEGNESREKLHDRINELLPKVGELSRNMEILNKKL